MQARKMSLVLTALALAGASFGADAGTYAFSNPSRVVISSGTENQGMPATPYPSPITVTGVSGRLDQMEVTLHGLSHEWLSDVSVMLVSPGGKQITLLNRVTTPFDPETDGRSVRDLTLTFRADGATYDGTTGIPLVSGTYRPWGGLRPFPAPAPASNGNGDMTVFNGTAANGSWSLYIMDQGQSDDGELAGGWSLNITTEEGPVIPTCASEGFTGIKLQWCQNICEKGYSGQLLSAWIHRWIDRFRTLPACAAGPGGGIE